MKLKSKTTATLLIAIFMISAFALTVSAIPGNELYSVGSGTATPDATNVKLYVADGTVDWAEVSIPVDIALKDITELKFKEYIDSYGPAQTTGVAGWSVNVVLGIDIENDGFTADVAEFHVGTNAWTLEALHGDTFIEMDGAFGVPPTDTWTETDALSVAQWYTPNEYCTAFAKSDPGDTATFYGSFADLIGVLLASGTQDSLIPDANARVKCIKLVIGGSVNWNFETAYVDDVTINGFTYDFESMPGSDVSIRTNVALGVPVISISVDPTDIDFGRLVQGESSTQSVTVTSSSTVQVRLHPFGSSALYSP